MRYRWIWAVFLYYAWRKRLNQINRIFKNDKDGWSKANEELSKQEKINAGDKDCDVVLVGAENIKELTYGYRNYFADTEEFIRNLKIIIEFADWL